MIYAKSFLGVVLAAAFVDLIVGQGLPTRVRGNPENGTMSSGGRDGFTKPNITDQSGQHRPDMVDHFKPDMKQTGMGGRPSPYACNASKLAAYQGESKLSEAEIATIIGVLNNTQKFESLLSFICKIPPACIRQLNMENKVNISTVLDNNRVVTAMCQCSEKREVIQTLIQRVSLATICKDVVKKLLQCDLSVQGKLFFTRLAEQHGCQDIPIEDKLKWSSLKLKASLESMTDAELKTFIKNLAQTPSDLLAIPCDNIKAVMNATEKRVIKSNWSTLTEIWNIVPFLSGSFCQEIPYDAIKDHEEWKNVDWYCMDHSMVRWDSSQWSSGFSGMSSGFSGMSSGFSGMPSESGGMSSGSSKHSSQGHDDRASRRMLEDTLKKCPFQCGRIIAKTVMKAASVSSSQLKEKLGTLQQCLDEKMIIDGIQAGMCKDVPQPKNPRNLRLVSSKCRPDKAVTDLTTDDVKNLGCRISDVFGKHDLKKIPDGVFCDGSVLKQLSESCPTSKHLSDTMAKKCVKDKLDQTLAANLGSAITQVKCDLLKNADKNTRDIMRDHILGGVDKSNPAKMTCMREVINDMPITDKIKSRAIMETQTCQTAAQQSKPKKNEILNGNVDPAYTHSQKSSVFQEFMGQGKKLSDLTVDEMKAFRNVIEGAKLDSMSRIPDGRKRDAMSLLGMYDGWDGKQINEIVANYIASLKDLNPENPLSELIPEDIDELSDTFLCGLRSAIKNMTSLTGRAVCSRLGKAEELTRFVKREDRIRLAYNCWDAIAKSELGEDDIEYLGNLLPELGQELLDKIPANVMKKTGDQFSRISCMRKNVTDYIQNKINKVTSSTDEDIPAGVWAARCNANKNKLLDKLDAIQGANRRTVSDDYCDREPMSDEERDAMRQSAQEVFDAIRELANTPDDGSRRRRATSSESCSVLDSDDYRDKLYLMSPQSIRDVSDFSDCIAAFGVTESWSKDQSDALWEQFTKAISDTSLCDLTSEQLVDMGTIGYSMSVEDINCLKNLDTDALGALGSKQAWTKEQENALMKQYMKLNNMNSPASLSSDELAAAGHLLCGLSADDIDKIDAAKYKEVSKTLGNIIKTCDQEALQALFKVATDTSAFGSVSSWESALYSDVCIISAGMSPDDVRQLNSDDIRFLCNEAIKAMTKDHFEIWTTDQLMALTIEQSYYLDDSELSDEQRKLLGGDNDTASDAGMAMYSFLSLLTAIVAAVTL